MQNKFEKNLANTFLFDRRRLPPLATLSAFEAAARLQSFSEAGRELHLTQGAISRQVKLFESFIGFSVFERTNQKVRLTDAGAVLAAGIREKLSELASVFDDVDNLENKELPLNLGILPTIGSHWLIPRLPEFIEKFPNIRVNVFSTGREFEFDKTLFDAVIFVLGAIPAGFLANKIANEDMVIVASPEWMASNKVSSPVDLYRKNILVQVNRQSTFDSCLLVNEVQFPGILRNPFFQFEHFAMVLQAAKSGMGAAVVPSLVVEQDLADGSLQRIGEKAARVSPGYFLAYQESRKDYPALRRFREWVLEVSDSLRSAEDQHLGDLMPVAANTHFTVFDSDSHPHRPAS